MRQPSSNDEMTIRHQFDRLCQIALKGETANYYKHMEYRRKYEVTFSEMSEKELSKLFVIDEYGVEQDHFEVYGYDIEVKDALTAEALKELTERKRNVILLSYFMEMSDADIARKMNLVRSTIHEHRTRSLEILKNIIEGIAYEKRNKHRAKEKLLPFHIIKAASEGDISAINVVLKHYEGYIIKLSTRKLYDEDGQIHYCVDETLRRRLETKLITKIVDFKLHYNQR